MFSAKQRAKTPKRPKKTTFKPRWTAGSLLIFLSILGFLESVVAVIECSAAQKTLTVIVG